MGSFVKEPFSMQILPANEWKLSTLQKSVILSFVFEVNTSVLSFTKELFVREI